MHWDPSPQQPVGIVHTQITVDTLVIGPQLPPQTQTLYILQVPSEGNQRHRGQ